MLAGAQVFVLNLMFKTEFVGLAIGLSRSVFIATSEHKGANGRKIFLSMCSTNKKLYVKSYMLLFVSIV
jgi:hypothetical protein